MSAVFLTKQEVAEHLGVHPSTIERWVAQRRIPSYKIGHLVRFDLDEVRAAVVVHREAVKR